MLTHDKCVIVCFCRSRQSVQLNTKLLSVFFEHSLEQHHPRPPRKAQPFRSPRQVVGKLAVATVPVAIVLSEAISRWAPNAWVVAGAGFEVGVSEVHLGRARD